MRRVSIPLIVALLLAVLTGCSGSPAPSPSASASATAKPTHTPTDAGVTETRAATAYYNAHAATLDPHHGGKKVYFTVLKDYCQGVSLNGRTAENQAEEQTLDANIVVGLQRVAAIYCPVTMAASK